MSEAVLCQWEAPDGVMCQILWNRGIKSGPQVANGLHGLTTEVNVELKRQELLSARDLKTINGWIFDHHNCRERGTIVVPENFWVLADKGTQEILINVARIEGWQYRIDPVALSPDLEPA